MVTKKGYVWQRTPRRTGRTLFTFHDLPTFSPVFINNPTHSSLVNYFFTLIPRGMQKSAVEYVPISVKSKGVWAGVYYYIWQHAA